MVGLVSNIVAAKKFGFISSDNGKEYFFHAQDMLTDWDELVRNFTSVGGGKIQVTFEPDKTPKGPRARNVEVYEA